MGKGYGTSQSTAPAGTRASLRFLVVVVVVVVVVVGGGTSEEVVDDTDDARCWALELELELGLELNLKLDAVAQPVLTLLSGEEIF